MITTRALRREFRTKTATVEAVRGLDLDVEEGELVAFLGPNGAGKSTSVRVLTTLLAPSSGSARVAGFDVQREAASVRRHIGYVGQGTGSGPYHRVRDELVTQGRAQRLTARAARERADELLAVLELDGLADRDCASLSGGQKRRLDVALGLVHTPRLLCLDEPTTGLDPHSRANLWQHLIELRERSGMTLFVTTHYLEEADGHAERVLIMDHGVLIADDTPARLKANVAGDSVRLEVRGDAPRAAEMAKNVPSARDVRLEGETLSLTLSDGEARLPALLRELDVAGIGVARAALKSPTLDDVFLGLTGRSLRETAAA
jgi:ABC-2 type transport system ATP-binding protein